MSTIYRDDPPLCAFCREPADYICDYCGRCYCVDCEPMRADDAPVECCPECIQTSDEEPGE